MLKEIKEYYPNKILKNHYFKKQDNDSIHGSLKSFKEDGSLGFEEIYNNGNIYGVCKYMDSNSEDILATEKNNVGYGILIYFYF